MGTSRNSPCPCGSGKKYKQCCGQAGAAAAALTEDWYGASKLLHDLLFLKQSGEHYARGLDHLWGPWAERLGEDQVESLCDNPIVSVGIIVYLTLDLELEGKGRTLIEDLLERRAAEIPTRVRRALEKLAVARIRPFEVLDSREGGRAVLASLTDAEEPFELEFGGPQVPDPGQILALRVVRDADGSPRIEGEVYPFPPSFRARVLERFAEEDNEPRDGRFYLHLWLEFCTVERPSRRSRSRYPHLTADLRHYLDEGDLSIRVPREARTMGLYLGRIAGATCTAPEGEAIDTELICRRRPDRRACGATLVAQVEPGGEIDWTCPGCGDGGVIHGWQDGPFDVRERAELLDRPQIDEPGHTLRAVALRPTDLRRLLGLLHLSAPALRLLATARLDTRGTWTLAGEPAELVALARCIAFHFARSQSLSAAAVSALARSPTASGVLSLATTGTELRRDCA